MAPKQRRQAATSSGRGGSQGKLIERTPVLPGHVSPGNSPFLKKLPREIRDKVYDELLIVQRTAEDRDKYDKIQAALQTGNHEYECERELDFMNQDYMLMSDISQPNRGGLFIGKNKGILLACKQIYEEATTTLFSKNLFGAGPQSERVEAFWRCGGKCVPINRPCLLRPETCSKIKRLLILINKPSDSPTEVNNLRTNLQAMVDTLLKSDSRLLTLQIRYWSQFGGEVETVRQELEGPLHPSMTERPPVMIKHAITGKFHIIRAVEADTKIFKNMTNIMQPLKSLKGVAEFVDIRSDLPQKYINELKKILTVKDPGPVAKQLEKAKVEAASKRSKPFGGLASFAAEMLAKDPNMDPSMKAHYQKLIKVSNKSMAVKAQIFPEMYDGSMHRPTGAQRALGSGGGIGVVNGSRPVFGPPRPPSMS